MRAGEASERRDDAAEGDRGWYVRACILVAVVVTVLFLWQPWNSNSSWSWARQAPPAAGTGR